MQSISLPIIVFVAIGVSALSGCGAKGDPKPGQRHPPASCAVRATGLRTIEVVLPTADIQGNRLSGVEVVRVYYLSLGTNYPSALEVLQHGEIIMERHRHDLPSPGKMITFDLSNFGRSSGWLVVVPFRVGNIAGAPSQVLPWLDPSF